LRINLIVRRMRRVAPRLEQRVIGSRRFRFQHVDPRASQVLVRHCIEHGKHVHDSAARGVHDKRAARHERNRLAIQDMPRLWRQRAVRADDMRLGEQFAQRLASAHSPVLFSAPSET
jgi:hypothetical protein